MLAASLYVLALIISHATLPPIHVWVIAAVFSILMNSTYVTEAFHARRWFALEAAIAVTLIVMSVLGVVLHPLFVVAAVFGHGVWDLVFTRRS